MNYPWSTDGQTIFYGLDFGGNVWGSHLGVSTRREAIARDFEEMARLGFTVARWFVFCDGRAGIVYDDRSLPAGLDAEFFVDVDAGLEIARAANMRVDFVLFDHHWLFRGIRHMLADPVSGDLLEARLPEGRARILLTQEGHDALFDHVIEPFVRRYGGGARADLRRQIFAFEFMNEPDFVVDEWERDRSPRVRRALPFESLAAAIARLSDVVHRHSPAIVTLGGARADNLWAWDSDALGLDMLQLHAYPDSPRPGDVDVFSTPARALDVRLVERRAREGACRRLRGRVAMELQRHGHVRAAAGRRAEAIRRAPPRAGEFTLRGPGRLTSEVRGSTVPNQSQVMSRLTRRQC